MKSPKSMPRFAKTRVIKTLRPKMTVDSFLNGDFMEDSDAEDDKQVISDEDESEQDDDDADQVADTASFASVDDLEGAFKSA